MIFYLVSWRTVSSDLDTCWCWPWPFQVWDMTPTWSMSSSCPTPRSSTMRSIAPPTSWTSAPWMRPSSPALTRRISTPESHLETPESWLAGQISTNESNWKCFFLTEIVTVCVNQMVKTELYTDKQTLMLIIVGQCKDLWCIIQTVTVLLVLCKHVYIYCSVLNLTDQLIITM